MAGKVTLGEVKRGEVTLVDLCKLNSMLEMQAAAEKRAAERARTNR